MNTYEPRRSFSLSDRIALELTKDELEQLQALLERDDPRLSDRIRSAVFPEKLINLTGHTVNIYDSENRLIKVIDPDPYRPVCRARGKKTASRFVCGVPIFDVTDPIVDNLPEPERDTFFIVSRVVAYAVEPRADLLVIDMQVKDESGRTIGCRGLTRV